MTDRYRKRRDQSITLNRIDNYINFMDESASVYLLFLSLLNFAAYGWAFYLRDGYLFEINIHQLFLIFTLIAVNWLFSALIIRDLNIKSLSTRWLNRHSEEEGLETLREYKEYLMDNGYYTTFSSWSMTKFLLAFFNAVPLAALVCVSIFQRFGEGQMAVVFFSSLFLLTGLAHIVLSCYSYDYNRM